MTSVVLFLMLVPSLPSGSAQMYCQALPPEPDLFIPAIVGTRWVYNVDDAEVTEAVTSVTRHNDHAVLAVDTIINGQKWMSEKLTVSQFDISRTELNGQPCDPPIFVLRSGLNPGQTWRVVHPGNAVGFTIDSEFIGWEVVDVPAGRYRAVRIDSSYSDRHNNRNLVSWYAPGVGLIKEEVWTSQSLGTSRKSLKSFTTGKKGNEKR
jgi:hypothetical protein